jgi:hypothetical protein
MKSYKISVRALYEAVYLYGKQNRKYYNNLLTVLQYNQLKNFLVRIAKS